MPPASIPVLYQDDDCLVVDKPAGLLTIPTDKGGESNLVDRVNEAYGPGLFPAHRLDRDTSGVILFARGRAHQETLMLAFQEKRVKKQYIAFVHGRVERSQGSIRIPVKDFYQRKFQRNAPAQSALTHYEVLDYYKQFTVVSVMPVTGRTNQIRIHFSKIGHPLVGEDKYAFRKDFELRFRRTALHAAKLEFPQPTTGKMIKVESPLAADMEAFLEKMK